MAKVKVVFNDIRVLWKFKHQTKDVPAILNRREVSLVGSYSEEDIALAEKVHNAKVYNVR